MLRLLARFEHVEVDRRRVVHDVGVVLAGEDVAGAAHVGGELIDLVEPPIDDASQTIAGSRRSPMTKSSASVSACSWNFKSTPRTQKTSRLSRFTRWLPMNRLRRTPAQSSRER